MAQYNAIWLPDALASPGKGRYLYRATDTGAVSYWDGSAWRAVRDAVTNATQLQGRGIASTAPTTGQALVWNGALWVPGNVGGAPEVLSDDLSGDGWTANTATGSGVASWETSPARLRLTCPLGSAASCGVHAENYVDSVAWGDLAIRVQVITGDGSSAGRIGVTVGRSTNDTVSVMLWPNSNIECGSYSAPTFYSLATAAGPDSGQRTGGELWLKIGRTPGAVSFAWGVGSAGALPTYWTTIATSTDAAVLTRGSGRYVEVYGLTTTSVAITADVLAVAQGLPGAF